MNTEDKVAAKWWADRLRFGAKMQSSSPDTRAISPKDSQTTDMIDIFSMLAASREPTLTEEQLDEFETILASIIRKRFMKEEDWQKAKENPHWGSAFRTLHVDYGACGELRAAYQAVGGNVGAGVFPIKTTMWINPGSVKVSYGYGSPEEELMISEKPVDATK